MYKKYVCVAHGEYIPEMNKFTECSIIAILSDVPVFDNVALFVAEDVMYLMIGHRVDTCVRQNIKNAHLKDICVNWKITSVYPEELASIFPIRYVLTDSKSEGINQKSFFDDPLSYTDFINRIEGAEDSYSAWKLLV